MIEGLMVTSEALVAHQTFVNVATTITRGEESTKMGCFVTFLSIVVSCSSLMITASMKFRMR